ncbi:Leucine zipper transcription factor-like protein 1 [Lobulomyces angularis]|nr:Leucine zipper transcription factor-like protein 1 [Lobulomyces angularis]
MNINSSVEISNYLIYSRLQRNKTLKELKTTIEEVINKLLESQEGTFNREDISMLQSQLKVELNTIINSELIFHAHSNTLLLNQYLNQKNDLKSNISELENRDLLLKIADFENSLFSNPNELPDFKFDQNDDKKETIEINKVPTEDLNIKENHELIKNENLNLKKEIDKLNFKLKNLEADLTTRLDKSKPVQNLINILKSKNDEIVYLKSLIK